MNGKLKVTLEYKNGDEDVLELVKPPWTWRTFLVLDDGGGELRYKPLVDIEEWRMAATAAV